MTTEVSRQRVFVPLTSTGLIVSRQRVFVPLVDSALQPGGGSDRRRQVMMGSV